MSEDRAAKPLRNTAQVSREALRNSESVRSCEGCGTTFVHDAIGRPPRFCSGPCRQRAYRKRAGRPGAMGPVPYWSDAAAALHVGRAQDVLELLPAGSVQTVVTSPPYYNLRDYQGHPDQLGQEPTVGAYVQALVEVMEAVRRVLRDDGTVWLNLGDTYAGRGDGVKRLPGRGHEDGQMAPRISTVATAPRKSLLMIPSRVAIALTDAGWILRSDVIWHKTNATPESVTDRPSSRYEHLLLLAKSPRYKFNLDAIREPHSAATLRRAQQKEPPARAARFGTPYEGVAAPQTFAIDQVMHPAGKNPGNVWQMATRPNPEAHFAMFPPALPDRCIRATTDVGDVVLDPFAGMATTGVVAKGLGRRFAGIELVQAYATAAAERLAATLPLTGQEP